MWMEGQAHRGKRMLTMQGNWWLSFVIELKYFKLEMDIKPSDVKSEDKITPKKKTLTCSQLYQKWNVLICSMCPNTLLSMVTTVLENP